MFRLFPVLIIVCWMHAVAAATVYQWTDENGNTVFSDQPHKDAKEVEVHDPQTYKPADLPVSPPDTSSRKKKSDDSANKRYSKLDIVQPVDDNALRSNNGQIDIELSLSPTLDTRVGDYIVVYLDDKIVIPSTTSTRFTLDNIDRGTHQLRAEIRGRDEKTALITSKSVTFHLLRYSALFKKPPTPTPK